MTVGPFGSLSPAAGSIYRSSDKFEMQERVIARVTTTSIGIGELDGVVKEQMERWTVPGIAVGILNDGEVETRAYGIANLETGYEMRPDTILQIGSISKIFTTTLLMMLVDKGLVDLDSPVSRYFPGLRLTTSATQDQVMVRQLVTHESGILGDHFEDFGWGDDALEEYVDSMSGLPQIYEPGATWSYTNSGFNLVGRIIETLLDMTFEDAVRKHIFEPLGMHHTFYFPHEAITYPVSAGHTLVDPKGDEHEVARRWPIPRASGPAGSISSTVADMLKFAQFHMSDGTVDGRRLLSQSLIKEMQEIHVDDAGLADSWGLGWQINLIGGTKVIGHGGSTNGFRAHLDIVPNHGFAIVTLTNGERGAAAYGVIVKTALEKWCGLKAPARGEIELDADLLNEYAGAYRAPLARVTVTPESGGIRLDVVSMSALADEVEEKPQPPVHATPYARDKFLVREGVQAGSKVDFLRRDDGSIRFLRYGGRVASPVGDE